MQIKTHSYAGVILTSLLWGLTQSHAAVEELAITIVKMPQPTPSGGPSELVIQTEVGAMCLGNIYSEINPNNRTRLGLKNVDREGKVKWAWEIDRKQAAGRWVINLQCATSTKKGSVHNPLEVPETGEGN